MEVKYSNTTIDFHTFVENLVSVVEAKDSYTAGHSNRVADFALMIAQALKLTPIEVEEIHMAAHLHDIGKIGICDGILLKPGRLSAVEFEVMKTHSEIGYNIIKKNHNMQTIAKMILHHHERYDGNGYPSQIKGNQIPLGARVIAVADAFDAMITKRTYKDQLSFEEAMTEIKKESGHQFDPSIASKFISIMTEEFVNQTLENQNHLR